MLFIRIRYGGFKKSGRYLRHQKVDLGLNNQTGCFAAGLIINPKVLTCYRLFGHEPEIIAPVIAGVY